MFKWKKLGRVFDPTKVKNRPWLREFAQCTSTLIFDDFVRVFFSCRPPRDSNGQYTSNTSFLDLDRKDLTKIIRIADKPILELGELGSFDEFGIYPSCVIKLGDIVCFYYAGWTRLVSTPFNVAIGLATSKDGENFKRWGKGPIMSRAPLEPFLLSGPKVRRFNDKLSSHLWMFYLAGERWIPNDQGKAEVVYKIRVAVSKDGVEWVRTGENILNDILGENECQAGPDVFSYDGAYHMYFSYRHGLDFRGNNRGYRIGYARSDDLYNWTRDDDNVGIGLSDSGWDSVDMHYPHVFECDGEMYMLYNGNEFGRFGFGLARLEK